MSPRKYLIILSCVATVGWAVFFLVLTKLEPCKAATALRMCPIQGGSLLLLLVSLAMAIASTCIAVGFGLRLWVNDFEVYREHLSISIRQGILLTLMALILVLFLLLNVLTWWSGLLLVSITVLLELYLVRRMEE